MAAPTVYALEDEIIQSISRLKNTAKSPVIGFMLGRSSEGAVSLLQCLAIAGSDNLASGLEEVNEEWTKVERHLPAGVDLCGIFWVSSSPADPKNLPGICKSFVQNKIKTSMKTSKLVIAPVCEDVLVPDCFYLYDVISKEVTPCQPRLGSDCSLTGMELVTFRIRSCLRLDIISSQDNDLEEVISHQLGNICSKVQSRATLYHVEQTDVLIKWGELAGGPLSKDSCAGDIVRTLREDDDGFTAQPARGSKRNQDKYTNRVLSLQMLFRLCPDDKGELTPVPTVRYHIHNEGCRISTVHLPLDVPVTVETDTPVAKLAELFSEGVCRQLRIMEDCLKSYYKECGLSVPRPYHFKFPHLANLFTVVYPAALPDSKLVSTRRDLHRRFLLPEDRPVFRRANAYSSDVTVGSYLVNTHVSLAPSGVQDGQVSLVRGSYAYHHYMQDRFNDDKWGCAYRSLQTLCSWFRLQGYTERSIPTHGEVQQALVDVGDKPRTFVGSRQWIGSFEVSTVLNQLLGVTSKLLYVSAGAEMANKGRELAQHFQTQGTPVMIGGGVLAHTILGVDFSETSGEVKFLILDPHYTGVEDLKVIQEKGWCGWKDVNFWDQTAYYNMCMPQRGVEI